MPFKDSQEGRTHSCTHRQDGEVCDKCLGKNKEEEIEFLLLVLYRYLRCLGVKPKDASLQVQRSRNKLL